MISRNITKSISNFENTKTVSINGSYIPPIDENVPKLCKGKQTK